MAPAFEPFGLLDSRLLHVDIRLLLVNIRLLGVWLRYAFCLLRHSPTAGVDGRVLQAIWLARYVAAAYRYPAATRQCPAAARQYPAVGRLAVLRALPTLALQP